MGIDQFYSHSQSLKFIGYIYEFKLRFSRTEAPTPPPSSVATTVSAILVGTSYPKYSAIIFDPINPNTIATAGSKYFKSAAAFDKIVYNERRPIIANILEEKITRGFCAKKS